MSSAECENAIAAATTAEKALLKTITANDTGQTGSHQVGFHLPKAAWPVFAPWGPENGENREQFVEITWQDGTVTQSCVKWYGVGTRNEFRLTRFGRGFEFLSPDYTGSLLVLVPQDSSTSRAWVLTSEDDIEEIQARLGVETTDGWAAYDVAASTVGRPLETASECTAREFNTFAGAITVLPTTKEISETAQRIIALCDKPFLHALADKQLTLLVRGEYELFQLVESTIYLPQVRSLQGGLKEFIDLAQKITQSRKARAGKSFEHHVEYVLKRGGVTFESQPELDHTNPDIVVPSSVAYYLNGPSRPKVSIIGIKRTCKDRWRQVLNEAPKADKRYIMTLQAAISENQLIEMRDSGVSLVVPREFHSGYPMNWRDWLYSVEDFIQLVKGER